MQFQIRCSHCGKPFGIEAQPGQTVRCNCPFCGQTAVVATPMEASASPVPTTQSPHPQPSHRKGEPPHWALGRKVTVVFAIVFFGIIALSAFLYVLFSAISK